MKSLLELPHYESIEMFYSSADDASRRRSGESDFGCWWYDGEQAWSGCWRVSCVKNTGEVYAIKERASRSTPEIPVGTVVVLGCVGVEDDDYSKSHATLAGWEDVCGCAASLEWAIAKLAPFRGQEPETVTLPLDRYDVGYLDGLASYAHWKDGTQYVGTTGRTLAAAAAEYRETWNYAPRPAVSGSAVPGEIADAVLADLERRKGIKNTLEEIEPEVYAAMRSELVAVVASVLAGRGTPG